MILKAEIQAFSYLPLKSAYPQKFILVSDGGTSELRVVGFCAKAKYPAGNRSTWLPPLFLPFLLFLFFLCCLVRLKGAWENQGRCRSHCGGFLRIIVELRRSCAAISHPPYRGGGA